MRKYKKKTIIVTIVTMVLLVLIVKTSYAVYQKEDEVTFINAKLRFPNASEIDYNSNNENVKTVEQALNDLYERLGK